MRKNTITALTLSAVLLLGGCSKAEGESAAVPEKTLAAEFSSRLDNGDYDIAFSIGGGTLDAMDVTMKRSGEDSVVTMDYGGVYTEFFNYDKQSYLILPEIHCYQLTDEYAFGNAFIKLGEGDRLVSVSEENGKTTEVYKSPADSGGEDTFTFVFDTANGAEGLEHITQQTDGAAVEIELGSVSWSCGAITLPELSEYDDISEDAMVTDVTQVKFYMYYTFGLNEDEAAAMGLDYTEIARMSYDDQQEFYRQLGEQLKGSDSVE